MKYNKEIFLVLVRLSVEFHPDPKVILDTNSNCETDCENFNDFIFSISDVIGRNNSSKEII